MNTVNQIARQFAELDRQIAELEIRREKVAEYARRAFEDGQRHMWWAEYERLSRDQRILILRRERLTRLAEGLR